MKPIEDINSLSRKVHSEPTGVEQKPYVLRYVRYYINLAKVASDDELLHGKIGAEVSSSICGALAWQGADGVKGDGWITPESEPLLSQMLDLSCKLDADNSNLEVWHDLFAVSSKLDEQ